MYGIVFPWAGQRELAKLGAGGRLHITRCAVGAGCAASAEAALELTDLIDYAYPATSTTPVHKNGRVYMEVEYRNDLNGGLDESFYIAEFGIWGRVDDDDEFLICYGGLSEMPRVVAAWDGGGDIDSQRFPVSFGLSSAATVVLDYNPKAFLTAEDLNDVMNQFADSVGSCVILDNFTVPAAGWAELEAPEGVYKYSASVLVAEAKDAHVPNVAFDPVSVLVASAAGVCSSVDAQDGVVVFLAEEIPVADLTGTLTLRSENLIDPDFDISGSGSCDCPDQATDDEVEDAVGEVFGDTTVVIPNSIQIATDEEAADATNGVFYPST